MLRLSHIALFSVLFAVCGIFIAAIVLDRWYLTTEDSLTKLYGLMNLCERDSCDGYSFSDGALPCIFPGSKHRSLHGGSQALFFMSLIVTGIAMVGALATSCWSRGEETRINIFGGLIAAVLFAALCSAISGALFFFIVRHFLFCGDFCRLAQIKNTSVQCYAGFGTSFALWGIATVLLFGTGLFGGILRLADKAAFAASPEGKRLAEQQKAAAEGRSDPFSDAIGAGGDSTDPDGSKKKAAGGGVHRDIPAGYIWDDESDLYWSAKDELYYDAESQQYYDPNRDEWYDPIKQVWYRCDS